VVLLRWLEGSSTLPAALTELSFEPTESDEKQLRALGAAIAIIRTDLMNRRLSSSIHFDSAVPSPMFRY